MDDSLVRRRLPRLRVVTVWVALMSLPLLLCLALSYGLSVLHYYNGSQKIADAGARRVEAILNTGSHLLDDLAGATAGECTPSTVAMMSKAMFQSLYFREAGIEHSGNLACTSLEILPPGFDIPNATRTPAARVGRMEILAPVQTLQGGQSIILNRPLDDSRRAFINLLLDPEVLVEVLDYLQDVDHATFLDDAPNGRFLPMASLAPRAVAELKPPLEEGAQFGDDGLYAVARAGPYPFYAVVAVSDATIASHWRTQMQPAVVSGFLLSGLAVLLLRRYLPKVDARSDLADGIEGNELRVWYQPIVDARDFRTVGAEALVRWQHPTRGLVMPDDFIDLAESTGLIEPLTERVLARVKKDLDAMPQLPEGFRITVNLSRAHLTDDSLLGTLDKLFGPGKTLGRLGFEITERELLANVAEQARQLVKVLTERGAEVALDDFGTGYSGLSHLRHLPLHHIKIDRSFVWALNTEAVTASLVDTIVQLAGSLGMGLVAEGVESEDQRQRLLAMGVTQHQGWLYAKAMPPEQLRKRMTPDAGV